LSKSAGGLYVGSLLSLSLTSASLIDPPFSPTGLYVGSLLSLWLTLASLIDPPFSPTVRSDCEEEILKSSTSSVLIATAAAAACANIQRSAGERSWLV
jgi:hypothetical protein